MKDQDFTSVIIWLGVFLAISIAISYFLLRWVFSIKRQLWNQKQQLLLLAKMAESMGVINREYAENIERKTETDDQFL